MKDATLQVVVVQATVRGKIASQGSQTLPTVVGEGHDLADIVSCTPWRAFTQKTQRLGKQVGVGFGASRGAGLGWEGEFEAQRPAIQVRVSARRPVSAALPSPAEHTLNGSSGR